MFGFSKRVRFLRRLNRDFYQIDQKTLLIDKKIVYFQIFLMKLSTNYT